MSQSPVTIVGIGHLGLPPLAVARHTLCLLQAVGLQVGGRIYPLRAAPHRLKTLTSSSPFCLGRPSQGAKVTRQHNPWDTQTPRKHAEVVI